MQRQRPLLLKIVNWSAAAWRRAGGPLLVFCLAAGVLGGAAEAADPVVPSLYPVQLEGGSELGSISDRSKAYLKFQPKDFKDKVQKYDTFVVLNEALDAAIAELVVVRVADSNNIAYAKINRAAANLPLAAYINRKIVRLAQARAAQADPSAWQGNPFVAFALQRSSAIASSANVMTGAELDPAVLSTGLKLALYAPRPSGLPWLNWLGLRYQTHTLSEASLAIRQARTDSTQDARITGKSSHLQLVLQPSFDGSLVRHFALLYGLQNQVKQELAFSASSLLPANTFSMTRAYTSYGVELALMPAANFLTGFSLMLAPAQAYSVSSSATTSGPALGKWQESRVSLWGQLTHPLAWGLRLQASVAVERRSDLISDSPDIGSGADHELVDWESAVSLGLLYTP